VRVGADHYAAGADESALHHHQVADPLGEEVADPVLGGELTDAAVQLAGGHAVRGEHVVEAEDGPRGVPDRHLQAAKGVDGERSGDVVGHHRVDLGDHCVAGVDGPAHAPAEYLFYQCSHLGLDSPDVWARRRGCAS